MAVELVGDVTRGLDRARESVRAGAEAGGMPELGEVVAGLGMVPAGERRERMYEALELAMFRLVPKVVGRLEEHLGEGQTALVQQKAAALVVKVCQWLRHERETDARIRQLVERPDEVKVSITVRKQDVESVEASRRALGAGRTVVSEALRGEVVGVDVGDGEGPEGE